MLLGKKEDFKHQYLQMSGLKLSKHGSETQLQGGGGVKK